MTTEIFEEQFQFEPLKSSNDSFRLLRLLAANQGQIECQISEESLAANDCSNYEALSYAWGNGDLTETINLNQKLLWITENLHTALQNLRHGDKDRTLWIDAVCINQKDAKEQGQQVQQMKRIYSQASSVIFWLGKPTTDAALLLYALKQLQLESAQLHTSDWRSRDDRWLSLWHNVQRNLEHKVKDLTKRCRSGLQWLLERQWFRRIWIVQEVANSQAAVICSGKLSVPADIFVLALFILEVPAVPKCQSIMDIMPGTSRQNSWLAEKRDLPSLLLKFRESKATDERDRIYALLGVSTSDLTGTKISADYTKTLEQLVTEVTDHLIKLPDIALDDILNYLMTFRSLNALCVIRVDLDLTNPRYFNDLVYESWQMFYQNKEVTLPKENVSIHIEQQNNKSDYNALSCYVQIGSLYMTDRGTWEKYLKMGLWNESYQNIKMLILTRIDWAIVEASRLGLEQILEFLLNHEDSSNTEAHRYFNALRIASLRGRFGVVKLLIEREPNIGSENYFSLLDIASGNGFDEIVGILLANGADVDARGALNRSALHTASYQGHNKVARMLLSKGADVDARDENLQTALFVASAFWHEEFLETLLSNGADINARDEKLQTALHLASYRGRDQAVRMLLLNGADVNARDDVLQTALHVASLQGHFRVVRMLLNNGADVNIKDIESETALEIAKRHNHDHIVGLLFESDAEVVESKKVSGKGPGSIIRE